MPESRAVATRDQFGPFTRDVSLFVHTNPRRSDQPLKREQRNIVPTLAVEREVRKSLPDDTTEFVAMA
jgi:hypothetical protein